MRIFKHETNFNFIGTSRVAVFVSGALVLAAIVATAIIGLNFGIDFAGGYEIQVKFPEAVTETRIRELVKPIGLGDARVQRFGDAGNNEYLILVREHGTVTDEEKQQIESELQKLAGGEQNLKLATFAESGENLRVAFRTPVTEEQLRPVIEAAGLEIKKLTRSEREDEPEYSVDLVSIADSIREALFAGLDLPADADIIQRVEFVGPQVGAQLRNQGILAVVYALLFILLYIAVRFDLYFSPGAVVALVHDVAITVGVFAVLQLEFNLPIIAAILALIGYSLNDTIVVYDRIRENALRLRGRELRAMVNTSINQTLSRTLLTSGTTLLVVVALLLFGGGIIRAFSIALLVGIVVGTYSSIWIASPLYVALRERSARRDGGQGRGKTSAAAA